MKIRQAYKIVKQYNKDLLAMPHENFKELWNAYKKFRLKKAFARMDKYERDLVREVNEEIYGKI